MSISLRNNAFAIATAVFMAEASAYAEDNYRMTMTGCQPDDVSIREASCKSGGHGVFHQGTGAACRLICPMPKTDSSDQWDNIVLLYKDPDGTGLEYQVLAYWKKAEVGSTVSTTMCSVDSNAPPSLTEYTNRKCRGVPGYYMTSFHPEPSTWYWLEVVLTRKNGATEDVEVLGYYIY